MEHRKHTPRRRRKQARIPASLRPAQSGPLNPDGTFTSRFIASCDFCDHLIIPGQTVRWNRKTLGGGAAHALCFDQGMIALRMNISRRPQRQEVECPLRCRTFYDPKIDGDEFGGTCPRRRQHRRTSLKVAPVFLD